MQVRLSRAEYWLLETVVDWPCPLTFLDASGYEKPEGIVEMFNKPGHGLTRDELIEVLVELAGHGLIEGYRGEQTVALDRQTIISALAEPRPRHNPACVHYKLTQEGGGVWEAFAAPDWPRLVSEERDDDARRGTLTGMVLWRVEKYLRYLDMLQYEVDLHSVEVDQIGPWEATYWKTLPHGHRARFHWGLERQPGGLENEFSRLAFSGFCEFRDRWYRWR